MSIASEITRLQSAHTDLNNYFEQLCKMKTNKGEKLVSEMPTAIPSALSTLKGQFNNEGAIYLWVDKGRPGLIDTEGLNNMRHYSTCFVHIGATMPLIYLDGYMYYMFARSNVAEEPYDVEKDYRTIGLVRYDRMYNLIHTERGINGYYDEDYDEFIADNVVIAFDYVLQQDSLYPSGIRRLDDSGETGTAGRHYDGVTHATYYVLESTYEQ